MDIVQLVALAVGVLGLVWHQQRSIDKLRAEMRQEIGSLRAEMGEEIGSLRAEMREEIGSLRAEMREEIGSLRAEVAANGQRLARIEGYLGIGMPDKAAAAAAGAGFVARAD